MAKPLLKTTSAGCLDKIGPVDAADATKPGHARAPKNRHAVGDDGSGSVRSSPEFLVAKRQCRYVRIGDTDVAVGTGPDHFAEKTHCSIKIERCDAHAENCRTRYHG
jgi:hypothetical protein